MSLRRKDPVDRLLEIPTATKLESFAPTRKSVSTDRKWLRLVPEFGRFLLSVRAIFRGKENNDNGGNSDGFGVAIVWALR